jgi:hypothetical protein
VTDGQTVTFDTGQILVAFPSDGHDISPRMMRSMWDVFAHDRENYGILADWACVETGANLCRARNQLAESFLESGCEWLLFWDSDMVVEKLSTVYDLLAVAKAHEFDIVGALCCIVTAERPIPTLYRPDEATITKALLDYPVDVIAEVAGTGTGFLLIHRTVLEKVQADAGGSRFAWFTEWAESGGNGDEQWIGEDVGFCLKARRLGFRVAVDTSTHVGHHKGNRTWWPKDIGKVAL